jgi:5'-3' exonuclease
MNDKGYVNIILDMNYILMKNVFTLNKLNILYGDFHKALQNNIDKYVNMFPAKIWLVFDSRQKSWRKELSNQYKAHRIKDETMDWDWIFKEFEAFKENIKETTNYKILQADRVEGDDWVMAVVKYNNKNSESNIVISSDRDLQQLLGFKDSKYINIQIDDKGGRERVFLPEGYDVYLSKLETNSNDDPFNLIQKDAQWGDLLIKLIKDWETEEINPNKLLFTKLVKGDKGDNIESIYKKLTKTGKFQGIGDAGADKIWDLYIQEFSEHINTKEDIFKNRIIECIELDKKITFDDDIKKTITKNIDHNIKLIELHYRHYPDYILESMLEQLELATSVS